MEKNLPVHLQEIIFGSSDPTISMQISKLEKKGQIRKIAPRLYSGNLEDSPEVIVRRNLYSILGHRYPNAVLSHRSALEFKPTSTGQVFLTYTYTKKVQLPGITIRILEGEKPIEGDKILSGNLYVSQKARALLENLQSSRKQGADSKTLTVADIEERLEQTVRVHGEEELNKLRDCAKGISEKLEMAKEFKKLDKIISALLRTHPSRILKSPIAAARAFGQPYDPARYELFEILYKELSLFEIKFIAEPNVDDVAFDNFAFFESYFSNYIEGTEFKLDEAEQIIRTQTPLPGRYGDSHDVLGTHKIVSNKNEMKKCPTTSDELLAILKYRHKVLLSVRISKKPGQFKDLNNEAGGTSFVQMELVRGTLIKSFDFYNALKHPFSRAAYMMFVISEVHPFLDGNGRIARVMMNAELTAANQAKILIPTVYREDYILALRKLTRQRKPESYIRMLSKIHAFSSKIVGNDFSEMKKILNDSNAFSEPSDEELKL
ncbi:MAG: Fic family protein [Aureispira sp.]|nr:Fic family protein [Aureispira sp.]